MEIRNNNDITHSDPETIQKLTFLNLTLLGIEPRTAEMVTQ